MNGVARTSLSTVALWDRPAEPAPHPHQSKVHAPAINEQDAYHPLRQDCWAAGQSILRKSERPKEINVKERFLK